MDDLKEIKTKHNDKLLAKRNVCGTAVGNKWVDGKPTDQPAILVFVQKKVKHDPNTLTAFAADDLVPEEIEGIVTDVIEVGELVKQNNQFKSKVRPIRPGYSCGHEKVTAGTMGGIFLDKDGDLVVLSNNHVVANENNARVNDIIFQPGKADQRKKVRFTGWNGNVSQLPYIGTLKKFVKLKKSGLNKQDSGIVKIHPKLIKANLVNGIYPTINKKLKGFNEAKVKMNVQKCGRTTGYTTGQVIGLHATFTIGYDFGAAKFEDCIVTTAMSKGGDSGSLILDMDMNAVGLLFAGSKKVTIANPIAPIASHYGLKIWNGEGFTPDRKPRGNIFRLNSDHWQQFTTDGNITLSKDGKKAEIVENANQHCFLQCRLDDFNSVSCKVRSGGKTGATWGPGIAIEWPTGMMKVNIRSKTFGGYFNSNYNIGIGKVKPNTEYIVRIRKTAKTYIGDVFDNGRWYTVIELPRSIFPMNPAYLRIGKTGDMGGTRDHARSGAAAGPMGKSLISDVQIK
jgi:hypothetical protein